MLLAVAAVAIFEGTAVRLDDRARYRKAEAARIGALRAVRERLEHLLAVFLGHARPLVTYLDLGDRPVGPATDEDVAAPVPNRVLDQVRHHLEDARRVDAEIAVVVGEQVQVPPLRNRDAVTGP